MKQLLLAALLLSCTFVTAVKLVLSKHQNRTLFVELQALEKDRDVLNREWGRLQLEQATWGTHGRVEELAAEKLSMHRPETQSVVFVTK
jgi:cell division protein FtsL